MRRYRKPYKIKKKKPIFFNRFFRFGVLIAIVAVPLFYSLIFLETFQIKKIIVSTGENTSKEKLESFIKERLESKMVFFTTRSIFLVDLEDIKKYVLNNFLRIAQVEIDRELPDTLNVVTIERKDVGAWCQNENCFLMDEGGIIFHLVSVESLEASPDLIKVFGAGSFALGEKVIGEEILNQILEIKSRLREKEKILIREAFLISDERLNAKTSEGWEIYFNLKGDLDWQITEVGLVLEKQIPPEEREDLEYIDVRFSRVYYKPR